jgi:hypothetical protein
MILAYGDYRHPLGQPAITIWRRTLLSAANTPLAVSERWEIAGLLQAATVQEMSEKIDALEAAYSEDGRDLVLYLPDGTTASSHYLASSQTLGGVRVVRPPSYPEGRGAQYATVRTFLVTLEAEVPVTSPETALVSFRETLELTGGGPRYGHLEPLVGWPIKQLLRRHTVFRALQRGEAVGWLAYPAAPPPLWPAALVEAGTSQAGSPRRRGLGAALAYTDFPISWSYKFESAGPLIGGPNVW